MASPQELKEQIENANALGVQNLSDKGVEISASATTYEIMSKIADVSGGGTRYSNITYNEDGSIVLVDTDGNTHTITCTYEDEKLVSCTYDGDAIGLTYDEDRLTRIGDVEVDFSTLFVLLSNTVYSHYGVSKDDYPYVAIQFLSSNSCVYIVFSKTVAITSSKITYTDCLRSVYSGYDFTDFDNVNGAMQYALSNVPKEDLKSLASAEATNSTAWTLYINFDKGKFTGTVYAI